MELKVFLKLIGKCSIMMLLQILFVGKFNYLLIQFILLRCEILSRDGLL